MLKESESAEWADSPQGALEFYLSLTFKEQTAIAWAVEQQKEATRKAMQTRMAEIREQYANFTPIQ